LGHEQVLTTFTSYGRVAPHRQAELIRAMDGSRVVGTDERLTEMLAETIRKYQSGRY
jgi:hypothetical protein